MNDVRPDEHGSATLLIVTVVALLTMVAVGMAIVGVYADAVHRARAGADLVALSAAVGQNRGAAPCPLAEEAARLNEVRLIDCELSGGPVEFAVSVTVEVDVGARVAGLPRAVRAEAHAGRLERSPP
ncbi:MAG: flp pilus-assembly TadE/G-like family protein [Propionibacterium sp.]|nr:flp pilus-assembly TadE/G-like family protein [Propionibacterium sp.]